MENEGEAEGVALAPLRSSYILYHQPPPPPQICQHVIHLTNPRGACKPERRLLPYARTRPDLNLERPHSFGILHSKAPWHVRFKYWGKTSCVANHASVR